MTINTGTASARPSRSTRNRSVSFLVFVLRFAEEGGVTIPVAPAERNENGRERVHVRLDTDQHGRPHLPGTSLAGALREMVSDQGGNPDKRFGCLLESGATIGAADQIVDARASDIWVLGSRWLGDEDAAPQFSSRASTKINRHRGAAEANTLRAEEVLPAGTRFEVFLRWDNAAPGEVEELAGQLAGWRAFLGRGVSRGRGQCVTESVRHGTLDLTDPNDLLQWLTESGPSLARAVATTKTDVPASLESAHLLSIPLTIVGPWRVGSGDPPTEQLITMLRVNGAPIMPGSALKGLLRSRAEFILRTVGVEPAPCQDQTCTKCWTCRVFGSGGGQDQESATVGQRSAIRVTDAPIENPVPIQRTHVALDRFTGGALDGALYTVEALEGGTFTLTVDEFSGTAGDISHEEIRAVLRLVLEDFNDGLIGMGAATARGYGSVSVGLDTAEASGALPTAAQARRILVGMAGES